MSLHKKAVKPTKKDALRIVENMKATQVINPVDVDSLILFFTPAAPKVAKAPIHWVAKACAKDDPREGLKFIYVDIKGTAWATDGHRVHMARDTGYPSGFHCPNTFKLVTGVSLEKSPFRTISRVMPNDNAPRKLLDFGALETVVKEVNLSEYHAGSDRVNKKLLDAAVNGKSPERLEVLEHGKGSQWYGCHELGTFLVMGLQ